MVKHSFECHFTLCWGRFRNVLSLVWCCWCVHLHACIVNMFLAFMPALLILLVNTLHVCIVEMLSTFSTFAQHSQLRDTLLTLWWTSTRTYRWPRTPFIWIVSKTGYMGKTLILIYSIKLFRKSCVFLQQGDDWRRPYRQWGGRRGGKILEVDVLQVGS